MGGLQDLAPFSIKNQTHHSINFFHMEVTTFITAKSSLTEANIEKGKWTPLPPPQVAEQGKKSVSLHR